MHAAICCPVEARLSRWLLQARDRVDADILKLTHEFCRRLLGVRRTTVTVVANMLRQAGLSVITAGASRSRTAEGSRGGRANATKPFASTSKRSRRQPGGSKRHRTPASLPGLTLPFGLPDLWRSKVRRCPRSRTAKIQIVAQNRKARFNYQIGEIFEAGIALTGTEVKSLRSGKATIAESYADARGGKIWLVNANIPEYLQGGRFNHAPKRMRKLLLHRRQINKLMGAVEREGMTLVPLKLYFNEKGRAKLELALARGKKLHDKRESEKRRSWERERGRLLRAKG